MLARGLIRHCPRCGSGHLFRRYIHLVDQCPKCNHLFNREEGFWLGAFMVNFAIAELVVAIMLFGFIFVQAANSSGKSLNVLPWLAAGGIGALVTPALFYPFSKTIWCAIDLIMHNGSVE